MKSLKFYVTITQFKYALLTNPNTNPMGTVKWDEEGVCLSILLKHN